MKLVLQSQLLIQKILIGNFITNRVLFAGDLVCLDYRDSRDNPRVCVWDHENSAELEPITYHVADTFKEFLGMLH
ncbi:SMI1/KNR4 family protein [Priestia megaterium]|uniref:SMI1/KNR4 family protein n=1 Tax=Priestia megaterium TaxID=1404 RepID=UPI00207AF608|nr:SMI1/KNR4 family protein [Priestia megaterium]USL40182.1 SMI1/KNR4 family protein [Priestia megaterium]